MQSLVQWPFFMLVHSVHSERLDGLWLCHSLFHIQQPLQGPRSLVALLNQENVFLKVLWEEWALPQGSKPLFICSPPPFAALWCNVSPWLSVESLDPAPPRALFYSKTSSPEAGPSTKLTPSMCLDHGLSCQPNHPLLADKGKNHLQQQVLSLPLGGTGSWWMLWLSVFKIQSRACEK